MSKLRQTSFLQKGAAILANKEGLEFAFPLFTDDVVGEAQKSQAYLGLEVKQVVRFYSPEVSLEQNFNLKRNSMEVLRTGIPGNSLLTPFPPVSNTYPSYYC